MNGAGKALAAGLLLMALAAPGLRADERAVRTVRAAAETVKAFAITRQRAIPPEQVRTAAAVLVIPQLLHAGLLVGGRFGRGVAVLRRSDGAWDDPVFVTLSGGSVGGLAGIEAVDLVLVFRTKQALEQALAGSFTLGGDAAVALGPVAREAEGDVRTGWPRSEVSCHLRNRGGLFAGLSLEGAWLNVDDAANDEFARLRPIQRTTALDLLRLELTRLSTPPVVVPIKPPRGQR
jgi:lipid-binding SYLF domain-containing protein